MYKLQFGYQGERDKGQGVGGGWVRTFQLSESMKGNRSETSRWWILNKSSSMVTILYRVMPKCKMREHP